MSQKAGWLKNERYIRIAGFLLMVSPFLNYLASVVFNSNINDKWAFKSLLTGFMLATGFSWLGRISNFIVGFLMFRGKSSAWIPVLAVLGFAIAKNIITFKNDFHISPWQTLVYLLVNVLLFLLVFESEYRINNELNKKLQAAKERHSENSAVSKPTAQALLTPLAKTLAPAAVAPMAEKRSQGFVITKGASIDFEGFGKFAEVIHCTDQELWLKATNHLPADIHKKTVTLKASGKKGQVRLKFSNIREDSVMIFRVIT